MGAVVVPLYTTAGVEETRHILADSAASLVAVNGDAAVAEAHGDGARFTRPAGHHPDDTLAGRAAGIRRDGQVPDLHFLADDCPSGGAADRGIARGSRDAHLYLGHDRAVQGRDADARQSAGQQRILAGRARSQRAGHDVVVPADRPFVRAHRRLLHGGAGRRHDLLRRRAGTDRAESARSEPDHRAHRAASARGRVRARDARGRSGAGRAARAVQ